MSKPALEPHIDLTERNILELEKRVTNQRIRIERLKAVGIDTTMEDRILKLQLEILGSLWQQRAVLFEKLEKYS
jgi:hypothetical protein